MRLDEAETGGDHPCMTGEGIDDPVPRSPGDEMPADAERLLVAYVRHRDVSCPRCDYSLRNAVSANCPECGEPLRITIGLERPIMGALLWTVAPALGCGVCAIIFILLIMISPGAPSGFIFMTGVMFLCGLGALVTLAQRRRFLRLSRASQAACAVTSLVIHALIVAMLIASILYQR